MPRTPEEILRKQEMPRGSDIWNLTTQNRDLIDKHIFWEIIGGQVAKFWNEAWQQREKFINHQELREMYREGVASNLTTVKDYWDEE